MNGNPALAGKDPIVGRSFLFCFNQHQMKQDFPQIKKKGANPQPSHMPGVFSSSSISVTPDLILIAAADR